MLYTELTQKAMIICYKAHKDRFDKGGVPYVFHPFHVAEQMETEEEICAALLHDVVEDSNWELEQLEAEGFPASVIEAVALLTHNDGSEYLDYVRRLKDNPIAAKVKMADLQHNSTAGRIPNMTERDRERLAKYRQALEILTDTEED